MNIASMISLSRLLMVCVLPVLGVLGWEQAYFWLLMVALGSDAVDGLLARHFNQASVLGAKLDSYADLALFLTVPIGMYLLFPELFSEHAMLLSLLIGGYLLALVIGLLRWKRVTSYHTWGAKLSAVLMGITVLAVFWVEPIAPLLYPSAVVAILSYVEEIAITFTLRRWEADVPSLWHARRRRLAFDAGGARGRAAG